MMLCEWRPCTTSQYTGALIGLAESFMVDFDGEEIDSLAAPSKFGSANLARQSIEAFQQYMAIALMFGAKAVDLRTYIVAGHYDARTCLSPASLELYEAVREVVGRPPSSERPYIRNDTGSRLGFVRRFPKKAD